MLRALRKAVGALLFVMPAMRLLGVKEAPKGHPAKRVMTHYWGCHHGPGADANLREEPRPSETVAAYRARPTC